MASPRLVVSALTKRSLSPRAASNFCNTSGRHSLSPRAPDKHLRVQNVGTNRALPFSIDTPNRKRIINNGLQDEEKSVLGTGSFGTVYKASYKGDQVAVKIIKRRKLSDAEVEAEKRASILRHPNIVRVLGIEQGSVWSMITMELCDTSLQNKLEKMRLTRNERIEMWRAIGSALNYCHMIGIIHADIKPKNILIASNGQPKLADFGSSIVIGEESKALLGSRGTPGYVAPEVVKGSFPSIKSDIYSLGVLAWQLLVRKAPYAGCHPHTILYLTGKGVRPFDNQPDKYIDDECHNEYKSLYKKLCSVNADNRPKLDIIIDQLNFLQNN
ncbi:serine/threonine-protein kinase mos-like [Chelonus insularis]|uniref:serine/threonine-protein kinase mos-like n=1 Tax=Chelonus insularis TaxID=460826 RepID=UPI00158E1683|nr:serine/threonine-protein kinase mos-like [Chelonus insularis]